MAKPKIDNPLFSKTDDLSSSIKVLNSKTLKVDEKPNESEKIQDPVLNSKTIKVPKFKTFKEQILVRLREDQVNFLTKMESSIKKNRSSQNRKERITKNTIIRTALDAMQALDINLNEISNEEELLERIKSKLKV